MGVVVLPFVLKRITELLLNSYYYFRLNNCIMNYTWLVTLIMGMFTFSSVQASFKCYACNWNRGIDSDVCIKNLVSPPGSILQVFEVECPEGSQCYAIENYYKGPKYTQDFGRGCEPVGSHPKAGCQDSAEILTCKQVCTNSLCNLGDGGRAEYERNNINPENNDNNNNNNNNNGANTMYFSSYLALAIIITYFVSLINFIK